MSHNHHQKFLEMAGGRKFDLLTFFCLYIAQSLPMTFFSTALQVTMRQAQFSLSSIALLQIIKLPWILKFLWSPLVDKRCTTMKGFRRCIFISEGIYAAIILLVGHLDLINNFNFIIGLIFLSFVASATQDIATDALAVLTFKHKEKGLVSSMQSLGSFSATLIGSGVLLALLQKYGWHYVLPFMSLFVFFAVIPLWKNKNLKFEEKPSSQPVKWSSIVSFFTQKKIWPQIAFLMLYYSGIIGLLSMLRPWLVDLGYSMAQIGLMSGIIGSAGACVASIFSGHFIAFKGRRLARRIFAGVAVATASYFLIIFQTEPSYTLLIIGVAMLWLTYGLCSVVVYTTSMDNCRPGLEGTDFTIQTVLTHLSGLLMTLSCGKIADTFGYTGFFTFCTIMTVVNLVYVMIWKRE